MAKHRYPAIPSDAAISPGGPVEVRPDEPGVAELAYQLWLARGCPNGSDQEDWFLAEGILRNKREMEAALLLGNSPVEKR